MTYRLNQRSDAVRRTFLLYTSAIIGVFTVLALGAALSDPTLSPVIFVLQGFLLLTCIAAFVLARLRRVRLGGVLLCLGLIVAISASGSPKELIQSTLGSAYILPIVVGGMVAGAEAALALSVINISVILLLAVFNNVQITTSSYTTLFILGILGGLNWFIFRSQRSLLNEATTQAQAVQAAKLELEDREQQLVQQNNSLQASNQQQAALLETVQSLEIPAIPVLSGVLVVPLVGYLDSRRIEALNKKTLNALHEQKSHTLIIDVTGIHVADTQVAQSLTQLARAARLLGTRVMMTGITSEIAKSLTYLNVSFEGIETEARLQDAINKINEESLLGAVRSSNDRFGNFSQRLH